MVIEQIYTGCLAQGAYFIESQGEAAIIDPLRESAPYLKRAEDAGAKIKYVFETHFHADFVSGHVDLARKTGAQIVYGPLAIAEFDVINAADEQEFKIGALTIRVLHTPGHTMESSCYLLLDEEGNQVAVFTGDTLFLGDVGRPDLAQRGKDLTREDLAGMLYDSLHRKIMPLEDHIVVYPAHGAGSACGKNMMNITQDTLGSQKKLNYALQTDLSREDFIVQLLDGLLPPPAYFPINVKLNKTGYTDIDQVMERGAKAIAPEDFKSVAQMEDALILDVRSAEEFAAEHVPGSIFIGLDGSFAPWVGELIVDIEQKILLVAPAGREEEAVKRLARVGFDHTLGFLDGGMDAWMKSGLETDNVKRLEPSQIEQIALENPETIHDCRKQTEYQTAHVENVKNYPLSNINENWKEYTEADEIIVHCRSGYRSMIAVSILKARGLHNIKDVLGGFMSIEQCNVPLVREQMA